MFCCVWVLSDGALLGNRMKSESLILCRCRSRATHRSDRVLTSSLWLTQRAGFTSCEAVQRLRC